jgi:hypothetical protein
MGIANQFPFGEAATVAATAAGLLSKVLLIETLFTTGGPL